MTIDVAQFRADFPEFNSSTQYPAGQVTFYLNYAYKLLSADRFGSLLDLAAELMVAHNIVLEARAQAEAADGAVPGTTTGAVNSKSVDKVSVGFDTSAGMEEGGGSWNQTIYGARLYKLIKMAGAGPIQIGVDGGSTLPFSSQLAYGGPWASTVPNVSG